MANSGRSRQPYTGFGRYVRRLMSDRDIRSWSELERLIQSKTGNRHLHQSMSKYAAGKVQVPNAFTRDFAATLELDPDERTELAVKYAYHSHATPES